MRFNVVSLIIFAVSAIALTITEPSTDDKVDLSKAYTIKWKTVESDPTKFTINLVKMNGSPNVKKEVAKDIKVSEGSYTIKDGVWGIEKGSGYQFNFISDEKFNTGILAQSQTFNVTAVADPPKNKTASATSTRATETAAAPTNSTAGSASLTIPAAFGSLLLSLFALL